jgi:hypothetical protein
MKVRWLLIILLVFALLLPLSSIFHSASLPTAAFAGIGQNSIVIAKEDNFFAKVSITVQPLSSEPGVSVTGGGFLPATITFPNGSKVDVPSTKTFVVVLPNTEVISSTSASGPGYDVSPSNPVSIQILSDQNATLMPGESIPGVHVFEYTVAGDAQISALVSGVIL